MCLCAPARLERRGLTPDKLLFLLLAVAGGTKGISITDMMQTSMPLMTGTKLSNCMYFSFTLWQFSYEEKERNKTTKTREHKHADALTHLNTISHLTTASSGGQFHGNRNQPTIRIFLFLNESPSALLLVHARRMQKERCACFYECLGCSVAPPEFIMIIARHG